MYYSQVSRNAACGFDHIRYDNGSTLFFRDDEPTTKQISLYTKAILYAFELATVSIAPTVYESIKVQKRSRGSSQLLGFHFAPEAFTSTGEWHPLRCSVSVYRSQRQCFKIELRAVDDVSFEPYKLYISAQDGYRCRHGAAAMLVLAAGGARWTPGDLSRNLRNAQLICPAQDTDSGCVPRRLWSRGTVGDTANRPGYLRLFGEPVEQSVPFPSDLYQHNHTPFDCGEVDFHE